MGILSGRLWRFSTVVMVATVALLGCPLTGASSAPGSLGPTGGKSLAFAGSVSDAYAYPGGRLLLLGEFPYYPDPGLVRVDSTGAPDPSFGDGGFVDVRADDLLVRRDGSIMLLGTRDTPVGTDAHLTLLRPDGKPDASFGDGGSRTVDLGKRLDRGYAIAGGPRGTILVGGTSGTWDYRGASDSTAVIVRVLPDGRLDRSFSKDGVTPLLAASEGGPTDIRLARHGGVLVAIDAVLGLKIIRVGEKGRVDRRFGDKGVLRTPGLFPGTGYKAFFAAEQIGVARDGNIVVVGSISYSDAPGSIKHVPAAVRYTPRGRRDRAFGRRGIAMGPAADLFSVEAVVVQRNGGVLLGCATANGIRPTADLAAVRFDARGRLDRRWGRRGIVRISVPGWDVVKAMVRSRGRLLMAGVNMDVEPPRPTLAEVPLRARRRR